MTPKSTIWTLDPHTRAKHIILRKYLNAWLPIITRWNGRVIFCDGFAGPGYYSRGEEGSPIIAIKAFLEHAHKERLKAEIVYLFIEARQDRFASLKEALKQFELPENVHVFPECDHYDHRLQSLLDVIEQNESKLAPTFAFIDPFGIKGIPLDTMARIMAHEKCEILVTFMREPLKRFLQQPEFEQHCDELFGCADWRHALVLQGAARDLFLIDLYKRRLSESNGVGAKYVRQFEMRNANNVPIYNLFFATNSSMAIDKMKDAMWKVDDSGNYSFSDATNPDQTMLFVAEPDFDALIDYLSVKFAGQTVPWSAVEEAIRETPFRIMKRPLRQHAAGPDPKFTILGAGPRGGLNRQSRFEFISAST